MSSLLPVLPLKFMAHFSITIVDMHICCGSLNTISSHNIIGSDTIRRCGYVGKDIALLEEVSRLLGFICSEYCPVF